jgi:hypothetical protein
VRFCKLALDNKVSGSLFGPSSWLMKSPPEQYHDDVARRLAEEFIAKPVGKPGKRLTAKAAATSGYGNGNGKGKGKGAVALTAKTIAAPAKPKAPAKAARRVVVRSRAKAAER